ncbi:MAG: hypothetical protein RLZZ436_2148 [Planctomycetota bacterium]
MSSPLSIIRGACGHDCPDTCAWLVEVADGQALSLRGDPRHPFTRGTLCAKVNHYLQRVYHPDRILHPLRRTGPKGQGTFRRITWDEALSEIATRWTRIIAESGAEALLPFSSAGNQGLIHHASLDQRLLGLLGASRLERNICGAVAHAGLCATQGNGVGINPEDLVHSRLIVLWGTNTIVTNLHLWPVIEEARRRGAKIICIDPIRTRTAEAADWHLQIRPGTDTVLALAVMHVLIRDGHIDHDYVSRHAQGYTELAERVQHWPPSRAAEITQLAASDIEQFASEYATIRPSLLRPLIGLEHHRNGAMMFRTIACLPILTGAWKLLGGGLSRSTGAFQYSLLNIDRLLMPETHQTGVRTLNMRDLGRDLCSKTLAPPIRSLLVWNANPAATMPNQPMVRRGLLREDLFTIVHDLFLTDTARFADIVLPATSQLEHLDLVPAWGHHYLTLNLPAIPPRGESVANTELFRRLAVALGRSEPSLQDSDETLIRTALNSSHPMLEGITFDTLQTLGWMHLNHPTDWRPFANGGFPTPSGKAELCAPSLQEFGVDPLPGPGDFDLPPPGMLQLISNKTLHFLNTGYSHLELHCRREGRLEIDLHPDDAAARNIQDGQLVVVSNPQGEVAAWCRVSTKVGRGVARLPFGGLVDALGRDTHVNLLTPEQPTDWAGGSGFYDTFVHVNPAAELS